MTIEESVGLLVVAVADDRDDRDDSEAATDDEEAAAADEDIEAKTEFAKVVSGCNVDVRVPAFECNNDLRMAVNVDCGGI